MSTRGAALSNAAGWLPGAPKPQGAPGRGRSGAAVDRAGREAEAVEVAGDRLRPERPAVRVERQRLPRALARTGVGLDHLSGAVDALDRLGLGHDRAAGAIPRRQQLEVADPARGAQVGE